MDGAELARWTRFAGKGGIGRCTATEDCVAENAEDLMFLKDDEIVVLMQLPSDDLYLGYCEGVVGRFHGAHVRFHARLKKPVMAKRSSTMSLGKSPTPSMILDRRDSLIDNNNDARLLVNSPSPITENTSSLRSPFSGDGPPRFVVKSPSNDNLGSFRPLLNTVNEASKDTLPSHIQGDGTPAEPSIHEDPHHRQENPRRHSTEETVVAEVTPDKPAEQNNQTRYPSPIMRRIRDQLAAEDSLVIDESEPERDSVVLYPTMRDSVAVSSRESTDDAGINLGLAFLQGSDDESLYSDEDEDDDMNSAPSPTVETTVNHGDEDPSIKVVSDQEDASDREEVAHLEPVYDEVKSRTVHDDSKSRMSTDTQDSKPRKSSDTYDPWGDIYDDYRYSRSTSKSVSVYSTRSQVTTNNPLPSPLLQARFGSPSSLELFTPELPPEPSTPTTPGTPPLTIRKRQIPVGDGERQSLFLPHPGAPKAPPQPLPALDERIPDPHTGNNLIPVMSQALKLGHPRPTFYARTLVELESAYGPVGIIFSIDPPPLVPPPNISFAPRTSSPLRSPSSPNFGPSPRGLPTLRERPRSRSFSDLRLTAGMQTQTVKNNTPTITTSRSMTNLYANGMSPAEVQEQRVSRVHVPEPIKVGVQASSRMGSFMPGSPREMESPNSLAPPSPGMGPPSPNMGPPSPGTTPPSPRLQSSNAIGRQPPSQGPRTPTQLGMGPSGPANMGPSDGPGFAPPGQGQSQGHPHGLSSNGQLQGFGPGPSSPPRQRAKSTMSPPPGRPRANSVHAAPPSMRARSNSTVSPLPRMDSVPPRQVANFATSNPSTSLSMLTRLPESRMMTPPNSPPPPRNATGLSPPPTQPMPNASSNSIARQVSPPPMALANGTPRQNSPSLGSMARVLSPAPNPNMGRDGSSASPAQSQAAHPLPTSVASMSMGRDSPVLGNMDTHRIMPSQDGGSSRSDGRPSLTLTPPLPTFAYRGESPLPSPASLSSFPLPPFASSSSNGSASPSPSVSYTPPPGPAPPQIGGPSMNDSPNRKLSLPNLRARTLSHRAESLSGMGPPRPSVDSESIRSGFSNSGERLNVRDMEFEMVTGQSGRASPSSPISLPRTSTNSFSTPPPPTPTLPQSLPPSQSAPATRSHTPTAAPHVRERESKFLKELGGSSKSKKKKVKKLVQEGGGVPMSVRWLVWMELVATSGGPLPIPVPNSGAVGGGLGGGGPGGRNAEALKALLATVEGEGGDRLKQAYRRMCPDVGWGDELDTVLRFLLALAPEQDAFWIFCCIMDSSLRQYFNRGSEDSTPQLEIDGELLARSLTKADAALSHHLLTTLGIPAGKIARGIGIRGAFVDRFKDPDDGEEGIRRVWDLWLSESDGLPLLIRTALTLLLHAPRKEALLRTRKVEDAMKILARPIQMPPDEMAWRNTKWKINDEDMRRERQRMTKVLADAARKKGSAAVGRVTGPGRSISLPTRP